MLGSIGKRWLDRVLNRGAGFGEERHLLCQSSLSRRSRGEEAMLRRWRQTLPLLGSYGKDGRKKDRSWEVGLGLGVPCSPVRWLYWWYWSERSVKGAVSALAAVLPGLAGSAAGCASASMAGTNLGACGSFALGVFIFQLCERLRCRETGGC